MGQSASQISCVSGGPRVRVMNTTGVFEDYDFPTMTAEVMLDHPNHLVVHCVPEERSTPPRNKITIMLPDQALLPGQPYMLYPIPDRHKKLLAKSKSFSMLQAQLDGSNTSKPTTLEKRHGRNKALKLIVTRLQMATFGSRKSTVEETKALTPMKEFEPVEEKKVRRAPRRRLDMPYWTPDLDSIPESPFGYHDIPPSPLGLYKSPNSFQRSFSGAYPGAATKSYPGATAIAPATSFRSTSSAATS